MAHLGVFPTKTSVNVTSSNGATGSIPAATPASAGCMTAEHARRLETLWAASQSGTGQTVVLESQPLPADLVSRDELHRVVQAIQRPAIPAPPPMIDITPLTQQLEDLRQRVETAPAVQHSTDPIVREVMTQVLAQMEDMDTRLRKVERVISTLQQVAEVRAAMEAAA